jgi:cyclopropane fatty-acyl-phospholipid synthase-like methyltransferase
MAATSDPIQLFTRQHATYERFIHLVRYPHGIRSFFLESPLLKSGLRVLDAGCGTGVITIALHDAMVRRSMPVESLHAFDLTPAMLEHFDSKLRARGGPVVEVRQASVLKPETLPEDWRGYDLIVSASMLEYVPTGRVQPLRICRIPQ